MPRFVFSYRPSKEYRPSEDAMAAWAAWFEQLGDSVVDRGNPVFESRTLGTFESPTRLGGYSLVAAENLDAAVALAGGCPLLRRGGAVEVGLLTELNPDG